MTTSIPHNDHRSLRAAIYVRVSSTGQEENYSLGTQERACRAYCDERGWPIIAMESDVHTGAEYRERHGLNRLREAIRRDDIDVVVSYAIDRLSRTQAHLAILLEEANDHDAQFEFVTESFEDSAIGIFLISARAFAAELEREKIVERTERGKRARIDSGKLPPRSRPTYGHRWNTDKSRLEIDHSTAPVVRRIFSMFLEGMSLRQIAIGLSKDGIPTAMGNSQWKPNSVNKILRHPSYAGLAFANRWRHVKSRKNGKMVSKLETRPREEWIELPPGTIAPIVTVGEWERAQAILDQNRESLRRTSKNPESALLREGFVKCGYCGRTLQVASTNKKPTYRCPGTLWISGSCQMPSIACHILDAQIWDQVARLHRHPEVIIDRIREQLGEDPSEADLRPMNRRIGEAEKRLGRYVKLIGDLGEEDDPAPFLKEIRSLRTEIEQLGTECDTIVAQIESWKLARTIIEGFLLPDMKEDLQDTLMWWEWDKRNEPQGWDDILDSDEYQEWVNRGKPEPVADESNDCEDGDRKPNAPDYVDISLDNAIGDAVSWEGKRTILRRLGVTVKLYRTDDPDHERWEMETALAIDPSLLYPSTGPYSPR